MAASGERNLNERVGDVGGHKTTTRGMAFIMAGHVRHHANVMKERYGIPVRA